MKRLLVPFILLFGSVLLQADEAEDWYQKGLKFRGAHEVAKARAAFQEALKLRPSHAYARYQLAQLNQNVGKHSAQKRATELTKVILPAIDLQDVTLDEALEALGHMIEKESAAQFGKEHIITPNFNIQDRSGKLREREVTIKLKKIPAKVALDYILDQAGAQARFDEYATMILPR